MIQRFLSFKVRAGSLMATLVMALIMATICSLLLLTSYYARLSAVKDEIDQRLTDDLASGSVLIYEKKGDTACSIRDSTLLFTGYTDSIYYANEVWGCFNAAYVKVFYKGRSKERTFFYGAASFKFNDATIYLADHGRAFALTDNTHIEGKFYLPSSGLYSGFFQGEGLSGKNLLKGPIDTSTGMLPALLPACKSFFDQLTRDYQPDADTASISPTDSLHRSFSQRHRTISLPSRTSINRQYFKGKLILVSDGEMEVSSSARLEDVILCARYIRFQKGFRGTVQAFARDSLIVESGCHFEYPSALISDSGADSAAITIYEGSTINGLILGITGPSGATPIIKVKSGATVKGIIYSEGYTQLNGRLEGAVFTSYFLDQRGPVKEENLMSNATIVPSGWFKKGAYAFIFKDATQKTVLKWLY